MLQGMLQNLRVKWKAGNGTVVMTCDSIGGQAVNRE